MEIKLDPWQEKVLETKGNIVLRSGRQVGKSTTIARKAAQFAVRNKKKNVLVIAAVERQAYLLFEKILGYMQEKYKSYIKTGKDRPTRHKMSLKNGSKIYCLPTGMTGYGIRGYTIDLLIADEAAFIPDEVWAAVTPMIATTKGNIILLSTPFGKRGYFYECFNDPNYTKFHINSEECPRIPKEFLEKEKKRMTKLQYAQEYLGEFIDELMQFFPTKLIKRCLVEKSRQVNGDTYLGVDIARLGKDETTFIVLTKYKDKFYMKECIITKETKLTDTIREIIRLEQRLKFKKIFIDSAGVGAGVYDVLLETDNVKRKIIPIDNSKRALDREEKPNKTKLMKEAIYSNLLLLMQSKRIEILDKPEIVHSLRSVQYEYTDEGRIKIFGRYTHIAEGLVRAAWGEQDKSLNIYIY